jgi:hypothetical protein
MRLFNKLLCLSCVLIVVVACSKDILVNQNAFEQTDFFEQVPTPKVDILWVIDNSQSTEDEQQKIAREAQAFLTTILDSSVDFQLGVITTDPSEGGMLRDYNGPLVTGCNGCSYVHGGIPCPNLDALRSSSSPAQVRSDCPALAVFQDLLQVGTDGTAMESAFDHALKALGFRLDPLTGLPLVGSDGEPVFEPTTFNNRFLRNDADLMLIFVSDEDESLGRVGTPLRYYERLFTMRKAATGKSITVASIVGWKYFTTGAPMPALEGLCDYLKPMYDNNPDNHANIENRWKEALANPSGCTNVDGSLAQSGMRYIELSCRMGGRLANICMDDYQQTLTSLADSVIRLGTQFRLSLPSQLDRGEDCVLLTADDPVLDCDDNGSTADLIDGALCVSVTNPGTVPVFIKNDAVSGWTYDVAQDAVYFEGGYEPAPGAQVNVRYRVTPGMGCGLN